MVFSLFLSLFFLLLQVFAEVSNSFASDPLVKAIQVESLRMQQYSTQELYYPSREIDPLAEFQPTPKGFIFSLNKKIDSVFPISFAFLYSLLPLNVQNMPYTNCIPIFFLLLAFKKFLNFRNFSLILLFFGTVIFPISFDFSENPIFLLLVGFGFIFFIKFLEQKESKFFFYSSVFLALAIWFRLEALIFYIALSLILILFLFIKQLDFKLLQLGYGFLTFLVLFLIFELFHYISYGAALGTRYIVNFQESPDFLSQLIIFVDIVFTRIEKGIPNFGFFFYSPILLVILIYGLKNLKKLTRTQQIIVLFSILLIFGIGLSAPNNGITITGRYLSSLAFPLVFLLDRNWDKLVQSKSRKIFVYILLTWTFLLSSISFVVLKFSFKNVKEYQSYFQRVPTNFWVFTSRASSGFIGFQYFTKKTLAVESPKDVEKFYKILQEHKISNFSLFFLEEKFIKNNELFQYNKTTMLYELSNLHYTCKFEETFRELERIDCHFKQQ